MKKIDHIAIATKSLPRSLEFFEKKMGITCTSIEELPERGIRVAFLPIGDTRIELIEPMADNSEVSGFLEKRGPGLHHIAFEPDDIDHEFQRLSSEGVTFTAKEIASGAHDARVVFVHPKSSEGVLIELTKPKRSH